MKLFEHQEKGVRLLTEHDSFALLWDMGSGKTLTMLMHLSNLVLSGEVNKILWLGPKSALGAVERDLITMSNNGLDYRASALKESITVMNYEKLSRKGSRWRDEVETTEWGAIVLDEAHCLCRPTSNRTKYIVGTAKTKGLVSNIPYRYAMTGTPVTNSRLEDLWSLMQIMTGGRYLPYREFESKYLKVRQLPNSYIKIVTGYTNQEELLDTVASYSQSLTKDDCLDLPEVMPDNIVKTQWKGNSKSLYDTALEEDIIYATEEVFDNALVRILRLRQIATGHITNDDSFIKLPNEKVEFCRELVENNHNKTVIFYNFKASFEQLKEMLDKAKIPFMFLNGDQKNKNVWMDFQKKSPEECRVFMVQYASGNAGIDLFTASDTIFFEPCLSSTVLNQARSRTHRQGVTRACTYTFLLQEGSVEEDIYEKLRNHEDFNEKLWIELKRKEFANED